MRKKWLIVAVVVALVAVVGLVGYPQLAEPRAADGDQAETAVARRGTLLVTVDATGSVVPGAEVSLSFSSSGRVEEVFVGEGQFVAAGQSLVRLDTADLELQIAQAEATLAAAEAQLAQLLASPRPEEVAVYEADLAAAQAQVSAAAANRDQVASGADEGEIAAAEAELASATAEQKSAYDAHESTMKCFTIKAGTRLPDGTVLPKDRKICPALGAPEEQARYALAVADASLASAQAQLDDLLAGADADRVRAARANVTTAVAQRDAAQAQLDLLLAEPTAGEIQEAQAAVDDARAAVAQAQLRLERATLTAPIGGTVTLLDVQAGEIASANRTVVVLSDLTTLEVEVNLDETDVARVKVGQDVWVSVDAFSGVEADRNHPLAGEVTTIASVAQPQSGVVLYPVTVRFAFPPSVPSASRGEVARFSHLPVRAGMTADVSVVVASQEDALIVPLRAVHTEGERAYVERLNDGSIERAEVVLGVMTATEIEITRGLSEGDVVLVVSGAAESGEERMPGPMGVFGGGR